MTGSESGLADSVLQTAQAWHAATQRGDCDWDAFTTWLEEDAAHPQAYAQVAALEGQIAQHRSALRAQLSQIGSARRRRAWPVAIAAALVLGVAVALTWNGM